MRRTPDPGAPAGAAGDGSVGKPWVGTHKLPHVSDAPKRKNPDLIHPVTLPDGSVTPLRVHLPEGRPRGIVILWPGMGMGARYYWPISRELAARGYAAVGSELRGQGDQTDRASWSRAWGYHDMAAVDFPRVVAEARALIQPEGVRLPVYFICHSMGGQVATLYLCRPEADVDAVVTVGSGSPYFRHFSGSPYRRLRWGAPGMAAVSGLLGHWPPGPHDLGNFGRQSRVHMREWAGFARRNRLRPRGADMDYRTAAMDVTTPVLTLTCGGDHDCPPESAMDLAARLPRAAEYDFIEQRLGHNRWAREPKAVVDRFERFIAERGVAPQ